MKYLWLTVMVLGLYVSALGQSITYSATEKPLPDILAEISTQYEVFFSYSSSELPSNSVSISVTDTPLSDFLDELLRPFSFNFEVIESNFIAIKPAEEIGVTLSIAVLDVNTNQPIELALVRQLNSYKGAYTNLEGVFTFFSGSPSKSKLEISHIGYKTQIFSALELFTSDTDTIYLESNTTELEGITVTEYLNTGIIIKEDASTLSLRPQSMDVLPGLTEPDALYSLQALPGITSTDESASGVSIRGSSTDQVSLYWDDIPIYHSGHYFGMVSSLIPTSINDVNVYRSLVPTQFGGAASGLLEMKGPEFLPGKATGQASSNLTHSSASVFIPFRKQALMVSGRRSFNDYLETNTYSSFRDKLFNASEFNRDGEIQESDDIKSQSLVFWDINAKWLWQPGFNDHISVSVFSNTNTLDFRTTNDEVNSASFQFHKVNTLGVNANWERFWSANFESKLSVSHSYYDLRYDFLHQREIDEEQLKVLDDHEEEDPDEPDEDEEEEDEEDPFDGGFESAEDSLSDSGVWTNGVNNTEFRLINTAIFGSNKLIFGGQVNLLNVNFTLQEKSVFSNDYIDRTRNSGAGYSLFGNYVWGYNQPFTINGGIRLSNFAFVNVVTADPQLSVTYTPSNWLQLKASAGRYHQYIRTLKNFDYSLSSRTEEIWFMADRDDDLPILRNEQASIGFVIQKNDWLLDFEAYSKQLSGLLSLNYNFGGLETDESSGKDNITGFDVLLRKRVNNYRTWISYSYLNAESTFPDFEDEHFPSFLDQKHKLQIVNTLSVGNFEFSAGWTFRTGAPYTEPKSEELIRIVEEDEDEIETEEYFTIDWGQTNSKRLPNYHRLDLSVWYSIPTNRTKRFKGEIGFSILNVYNRTNLLNRFYYPDDIDSDEEIEIVEEERYLLGRTPNLSIRLSF